MSKSKAQRMFEAYNGHGPNPWHTFDGRRVPTWDEINDRTREKWEAAARIDGETQDVHEFMTKFGQLPTDGRSAPRMLTARKLFERHDFLAEELREFHNAIERLDMAELADALVDLVYVAKGTANLLGLPWSKLWDDVQRANMAKVRGIGKRGNLVDCVKPPGWVPPRTMEILLEAGFNPKDESVWDDPEHGGGK